ncbi:MAG: DNA cytosine methyltransferase [Actinoallomurus sp.]
MPRLLDLFSGAGGAGMGYARAGFDVTGVDIAPQPRYPFEFHQADALEYLAAHGREYDVIHASPPCQDHSSLAFATAAPKHGTAWLLEETITRLTDLGAPFVVENVPGAKAHMPGAFTLCGRSFGIAQLRRHRLFLVNFPILAPSCACDGTQVLGIYGDLSRNNRPVANSKDGYVRMRAGYETARRLLDCPWMDARELSQAIPPAYTEFIGEQLLDHLKAGAA